MKVKRYGGIIKDREYLQSVKLIPEKDSDYVLALAIADYCDGDSYMLLRIMFPDGDLPEGMICTSRKETNE